eukprot:5020500-Pleurochrysis_carterae.AAC.6
MYIIGWVFVPAHVRQRLEHFVPVDAVNAGHFKANGTGATLPLPTIASELLAHAAPSSFLRGTTRAAASSPFLSRTSYRASAFGVTVMPWLTHELKAYGEPNNSKMQCQRHLIQDLNNAGPSGEAAIQALREMGNLPRSKISLFLVFILLLAFSCVHTTRRCKIGRRSSRPTSLLAMPISPVSTCPTSLQLRYLLAFAPSLRPQTTLPSLGATLNAAVRLGDELKEKACALAVKVDYWSRPYDTVSCILPLHSYSSVLLQHFTEELESTLSSLHGPPLPPSSVVVDAAVASYLSV